MFDDKVDILNWQTSSYEISPKSVKIHLARLVDLNCRKKCRSCRHCEMRAEDDHFKCISDDPLLPDVRNINSIFFNEFA